MLLFGILVVGAYAAYKFAQYVINDDIMGLAYAGACILGGAIVVAILNNWRNGVYFFLSWLLFEDFVRKFLGYYMAIYFAKDFLVLVVYISFFAAVRRKEVYRFPPSVSYAAFDLYLVWRNSDIQSGLHSHHVWTDGNEDLLLLRPLIVCGLRAFEFERELRRFFTINLVLILIIVSLGIAQSIIRPTFLNPAVQAEDLREVSTLYQASRSLAIAYRPTSVFVSSADGFHHVGWLLVLGFSGYLLLRHKREVLASSPSW